MPGAQALDLNPGPAHGQLITWRDEDALSHHIVGLDRHKALPKGRPGAAGLTERLAPHPYAAALVSFVPTRAQVSVRELRSRRRGL